MIFFLKPFNYEKIRICLWTIKKLTKLKDGEIHKVDNFERIEIRFLCKLGQKFIFTFLNSLKAHLLRVE